MEISIVKRKFTFKGKDFDDIPNMNEQEVLKTYSGTNPELTNATVEYEGMDDNGTQKYKFVTTQGKKG